MNLQHQEGAIFFHLNAEPQSKILSLSLQLHLPLARCYASQAVTIVKDKKNKKKTNKQSQPNANQHVCKKISNELTPVFTGLPYCSLRQSYSIGEGAIESPIRPIIWLQRRLLKPNVTRLPHRISISRGTSEHWGKYAEMEIVSAPGLERSTVKAKDQN